MTDKINTDVRQIIEAAEATLTHKEMAKMCGVTEGTIKRWKEVDRAKANVIAPLEAYVQTGAVPQPMDPVTESALEVVNMEQTREAIAITEQQERENMIAQINRMAGRIETTDLFGNMATVAGLVWLKQVKDSGEYKVIGSWETFCNYCGKSRRVVDEQLQNLDTFGENFMATCRHFSLGYRELRKLRYATKEGDLQIESNAITIGEEQIPIDQDHAEDLQAAIEGLLDKRDKDLDEQKATVKAKERIIGQQVKTIEAQEQELQKYEKEVKERGYKPGEEEFLRELERIKLQFVAIEAKLDPETIDLTGDDATPRMIADYLALVDYIRRVGRALDDTAKDFYGNPDQDGGWVPPYERKAGQEDYALDLSELGSSQELETEGE